MKDEELTKEPGAWPVEARLSPSKNRAEAPRHPALDKLSMLMEKSEALIANLDHEPKGQALAYLYQDLKDYLTKLRGSGPTAHDLTRASGGGAPGLIEQLGLEHHAGTKRKKEFQI